MPKILIVDDASTDRARVAGIASRWLDCCILEADNGKSALDQIEMHLPDLVLTDLHMPEMDGLKLVSAVKDDYPHIPVILMTGQGSEEIAARALREGAASYVPKMQLADNLINTLTQVHNTAQIAHSQSRLMHYMTDTRTTFVIPNDRQFLSVCINQLLNMLRCMPLGDETERMRVGIALQEALDNAYYHGNLEVGRSVNGDSAELDRLAESRVWVEPFVHRRIHVTTNINRERATFVIRDDGTGFDTAFVANADRVAGDGGRRGRGITLMMSIMDDVTFNDAGNEVTMVRNAVTADESE
jgi:CheY-like chemotaxis protein/anti-sigma regulatory factor (Ser/Thr protein kinase)